MSQENAQIHVERENSGATNNGSPRNGRLNHVMDITSLKTQWEHMQETIICKAVTSGMV